MTEKPPQHWDLALPAGTHRVSVQPTSWSRVVTWTVDGETVAEKRSSEDKLVLAAEEYGAVRVLFNWSGRSTRATYFGPDEVAQAYLGVGGVDLVPEPGSPAAVREERMRARPHLYAARHVVAGVVKVVVPLVVVWMLARLAVGIPFPDLPRPNLPDLPDLIPDIPWPSIDWPRWHLPGWVRAVLEAKNYVLPVLIGIALAYAEIRRRRKQDEFRAQREAASDET